MDLAQPGRPHRRPGEQPRIVAQVVRRFEDHRRVANERGTALAVAGEDARHALGQQGKERGTRGRLLDSNRVDALDRALHRAGVAGVERRQSGLGEHGHRPLWIDLSCPPRGVEQDGLCLLDRAPADRDMAA